MQGEIIDKLIKRLDNLEQRINKLETDSIYNNKKLGINKVLPAINLKKVIE